MVTALVRTAVERAPAGKGPSSVKQTSGAIGDSQGVLVSVLALTDDGVVVCDADGTVTEMNEVAAMMLGWGQAGSALGRPIEDVLDQANPSDAQGQRMTGDELEQRAAASPLGVRVRLRPRAPSRSTLGSHLDGIRLNGGAAVFLLRDLSALVAAEDAAHQYKRTADVALDAIYLAEPDSLRIVYANEGAARQSGWSREALADRTLDELVPLLDLGSVREAIGGDGAAQPRPSTVPTVLRNRDGDLRPVDVLVQPLDLDDGRARSWRRPRRDRAGRVAGQAPATRPAGARTDRRARGDLGRHRRRGRGLRRRRRGDAGEPGHPRRPRARQDPHVCRPPRRAR